MKDSDVKQMQKRLDKYEKLSTAIGVRQETLRQLSTMTSNAEITRIVVHSRGDQPCSIWLNGISTRQLKELLAPTVTAQMNALIEERKEL